MRFQLIVTTLGRSQELARLLASLEEQSHRDLGVLVVDQSEGRDVATTLEARDWSFQVERAQSSRGLSRGRNEGLRRLAALEPAPDVIAFPDDDCWYRPDTLERAARLLEAAGRDGVSGSAADERGRPSTARWDPAPGPIEPANVWRRAVSFTLFLRTHVVREIGPFDETLGIGAGTPWGSGEETDYLLRALEHGFALYYEPSLIVHHPQKERSPVVAISYGRGMARVLRTHGYSPWFRSKAVLRPLGGSLLSLVRGRGRQARYHWAVFKGRLAGSLR